MTASVADRVEVRLAPGEAQARGTADRHDPVASASQVAAAAHRTRASDPVAAHTREALGLGAWRGAATGHQPIFWHGGILAKALCAAELSRAQGHGWLHLIADHDAVDPTALPYPALRGAGAVRCATAHFRTPAPARVAAVAVPASPARTADRACPFPPAAAEVSSRLERIASAIRSADGSRDPARSTVDANFALLASMGALERPSHVLRASSLLRTPLGRACVERIAADPEACARAFNDALAHAPRAASTLRVSGDASEVPIWELGDRGDRARIDGRRLRALLRDGALDAQRDAHAGEQAAQDGASAAGAAGAAPDRPATHFARQAGACPLLPRAFLATGIVRALGIHFVHGTGGEAYERAGDIWWRTGLGISLPPFSVATADLRFAPASFGLGAAEGPRALTWREAWVDPARLDGADRDPLRARELAAIASMPRRSAARRAAFASMRARVESLRAERRAALDALARDDAARANARVSLDAATDRAYPAALHDADALAALAGLVAGAMSASASCSPASGSRR